MTRRAHSYLSSLAFACATGAMVVFVVLTFFIPYMRLIWEESGKELSGFETAIIKLSDVARAGGFFIGIPLGMLMLGSLAWRVYAAMRPKRAADQTLVDVDAL